MKHQFFHWLSVWIAFGTVAYAQAPASIIGHVFDTSHSVLQQAQIEITPKVGTVTADQSGNFTVPNLAPGSYKVKVSYVGFKTFESDITLAAGQTQKLDVELQVETKAESIIVTAERAHGETEGIERTKEADNILQVLSGDVIVSLPNANVADALGRLPSVTLARDEGEGIYVQVRGTEPRLTNVTINGISIPSPESGVRQVRLDALPADLVESVEINKTLAANMDGDGIGGSVNLKTKFATDTPIFSLNGLGGYNASMGGRTNNQFGGTYGQRFLINKKLGILFGGSYDHNGRAIDDVEPSINPLSTPTNILYKSNTDREYRYYRDRYGFAGTLDYKFTDLTDIYVKGIYSDLKDFGDKWYYGPSATGNPKFYTSSKRPEFSITSVSLGGHHYMTSSWINWEASVSRSYQTAAAGNPKADFSWLGSKYVCGYSAAAQTNVYTPQFGNGCENENTPLQNASNWGFADITTSTGITSQLNLSAAVNYSRDYSLLGHRATFAAGGKVRNGHKLQDGTETVYDGWKATSFPMTQFLSTFNSYNYYNNSYFGGHYGPVSDFDQLQNYTQSNLTNYVDGYKSAAASLANQFDFIERISAGYIMNTVDVGHLRIVAGLRLEQTNVDTLGYNVTLFAAGSKNCPTATGCGVASRAPGTYKYIDPLPSLSLKYTLTNDSAIRAVYSRGIARPDPYQLIPYASQDDSTNPASVAIGNPNLRPTHANSYDLLYEKYLKPIGMIQVGGFAKQITSPQVNLLYTATTGNYAGSPVTQTVNGGNASLYGFEVSYQQHLAFLPGLLSGIGINANYSYTTSQIGGLPNRTDKPALQRQTPNTWNISPTYDHKRLSMRLGLTYNGPTIYQYAYTTAGDLNNSGPNGPSGDTYTYSHLQVDAQGSYRIARGLTAVIYGLNLTNEPFGYYAGSPYYVMQREYYKATVAVGFRYDFFRERN